MADMVPIVREAFDEHSTATGPLPGPLEPTIVVHLCNQYNGLRPGQPFLVVSLLTVPANGAPERLVTAYFLAVKPASIPSSDFQMITASGVVLRCEKFAKCHGGALEVVDGNVFVDPRTVASRTSVLFGETEIRRWLLGDDFAAPEKIWLGKKRKAFIKLLRMADKIGFSFALKPFPDLRKITSEAITANVRHLARIVSRVRAGESSEDAKRIVLELRQFGYSVSDISNLLLAARVREARAEIDAFFERLQNPPH